jgi:hypothetical protein
LCLVFRCHPSLTQVNVSPAVQGIAGSVFANWLQALGIWLCRKYLLKKYWLPTLTVTILVVSLTVFLVNVCVDLHWVRNQYFYVGMPLLKEIAAGIMYVVSSFASVECATVGAEGLMFGFLTSVQSITKPLTALVSNALVTFFNLYSADGLLIDDAASGKRMLYLDVTILLIQLASIPFIFRFYPCHKRTRVVRHVRCVWWSNRAQKWVVLEVWWTLIIHKICQHR